METAGELSSAADVLMFYSSQPQIEKIESQSKASQDTNQTNEFSRMNTLRDSMGLKGVSTLSSNEGKNDAHRQWSRNFPFLRGSHSIRRLCNSMINSNWFKVIQAIIIFIFLIGAPFVDLTTLMPKKDAFIQIPRVATIVFLYVQIACFGMNILLGKLLLISHFL
jgi:hypothetical protein